MKKNTVILNIEQFMAKLVEHVLRDTSFLTRIMDARFGEINPEKHLEFHLLNVLYTLRVFKLIFL